MIARALEEEATDYIVKPFSSTELVARVRAALRRFEEPRRGEAAGPFLLGELDHRLREAPGDGLGGSRWS